MFKRVKTTAVVLLLVLAAPSRLICKRRGGTRHGKCSDQGHPAPGPANAGGMNNAAVDPSGIANANKVAPIPPPRITVPVVPRFK